MSPYKENAELSRLKMSAFNLLPWSLGGFIRTRLDSSFLIFIFFHDFYPYADSLTRLYYLSFPSGETIKYKNGIVIIQAQEIAIDIGCY